MSDPLSDLILDIHRDSVACDASDTFCAKALKRLRSRVPFQIAALMRGSISENSAQLHCQHLVDQSSEAPEALAGEGIIDDAPLLVRCMASPGVAIRMSIAGYGAAEVRMFLAHRQYRHLMAMTVFDWKLGLFAGLGLGLGLGRGDTTAPFTEAETAIFEFAAPHVIEGWTRSVVLEAARPPAGFASPFAVAVLTRCQVLTAAEREFLRLMREEWPDWRGPTLPEQALASITMDTDSVWTGKQIVLYSQPIDIGTLIRIRRRCPIDSLGRRKQAVAIHFSRGASQKEVSRKLNLSESTVNNYLNDVYRTLGLSDKVSLSRMVSRLVPETGGVAR
ncbi:MAG: LuxR C-terminal-related transcriptional regulator [Burkholderiaceae bacterium]